MSYTPEIQNIISTNNSVVLTNVSGGTVWYGTGEDVTKYGRAGISIWTPFGEFCDGVLTIEVSRDGVNWGGPNRDFSNTAIAQPHMWNIVEQYFRLKYTHGTTSASTLVIQTQYSVNADTLLGHQLNETLIDETEAIITRSVNVGQEPDGTYSNFKADGVGFQTTDNLASGATYNSSIIDARGYTQLQTHIVSSNDGTLGFKFCSTANCSGTTVGQNGVERYISLPYSSSGGFQLFSAPAFTPYVQYSFANGGTGTTTQLYYETKLLTKPLSGQLLGLNAAINKSMVANLGRNVIVGQDQAGNFRNSSVDAEGHLKVHLDEPLTAFGELRNAEITPIIQVTHPYEINYDLLSSGGTGSGSLTYDSTNTMVEINSGAASSSSAYMRTNSLAKYRNGQGMLIRFTNVFATPASGNTQWAGWGDSSDGFFFGYSGTTFGVMRRSNAVDYFTPQTEWNVDKFDGSLSTTNPAGELLNPQNGNVYEMQVQWLGFGAVKFNIEGNSSGQFEPAHSINYANAYTVPSTINPSFPLWFESKNTTNTSNIVMKTPSMAAFVEGKVNYTGRNYSFRSSTASTTNTHVFTLNVPSTYKGKTNRSRVLLKTYSVIADQSNGAAVAIQFIKNATVTGTNYSAVGTYSIVSGSTDGVYSGGTGRVLYDIELNKVSNATGNIQELEIFVNAGERLSVITNGSNNAISCALSWVEDI